MRQMSMIAGTLWCSPVPFRTGYLAMRESTAQTLAQCHDCVAEVLAEDVEVMKVRMQRRRRRTEQWPQQQQ